MVQTRSIDRWLVDLADRNTKLNNYQDRSKMRDKMMVLWRYQMHAMQMQTLNLRNLSQKSNISHKNIVICYENDNIFKIVFIFLTFFYNWKLGWHLSNSVLIFLIKMWFSQTPNWPNPLTLLLKWYMKSKSYGAFEFMCLCTFEV